MCTTDTGLSGKAHQGAEPVPVVLSINPELGRNVREARLRRGWTVDDLSAMIGPVGDPPHALGRTPVTRLEQGRRNISAEIAWRLIEIFDEPQFDPWEVLTAARVVPPDSSAQLRAAVLKEAESRRRLSARLAQRGRLTAVSTHRVRRGNSCSPRPPRHRRRLLAPAHIGQRVPA
jgi:transcriptional regulator with XRE-family HTH domain